MNTITSPIPKNTTIIQCLNSTIQKINIRKQYIQFVLIPNTKPIKMVQHQSATHMALFVDTLHVGIFISIPYKE